jgi:hypothetical protein
LRLARWRTKFLSNLTQIQRQFPGFKSLQPALKMAIAIDWLPGRKLYAAALKPLKICRPGQLSVQPWRRNLQHVRPSGYRILYIKNRTDFAAELRAIFMRDPVRLVDKNPQHARLAGPTQLNFNYLNAQRCRYAVSDRAYVIKVNCHKNQ